MRILILTPIPFWHPGTRELMKGLTDRHLIVSALDIWSFTVCDENGRTQSLIPKGFNRFTSKLYMRIFRRRLLKNQIKAYDIVDIHWVGHYYAKYIPILIRGNRQFVATLFGSDLLRSNDRELSIQSKIFLHADKIVLGQNMHEEFEKHFPGLSHKIVHNQYGSARMEMIPQLNTPENRMRVRAKYNIPMEKIVVSLGYNAKTVQQHALFLDQVMTAPESLKEKIYLMLPMTYGDGDNYPDQLKAMLTSTGIPFICLEDRISDLEIAETKIISDITLNFQTTDALSSSIKEAFAAKDILLAGDWLPYQIYADMGIFFLFTSKEKILDRFQEIIYNLESYKKKCETNPEKILKFAGWEFLIPRFIHTYKEICNGKS